MSLSSHTHSMAYIRLMFQKLQHSPSHPAFQSGEILPGKWAGIGEQRAEMGKGNCGGLVMVFGHLEPAMHTCSPWSAN